MDDLGMFAGLAGGFAVATGIVVLMGVGDIVFSYNPLLTINKGDTLQQWMSKMTGIAQVRGA